MSTIERAGSVPEPSRAPERIEPLALPAAWPVKRESPAFCGLVTVEDSDRARVHGAVGSHRHGAARLAQHRVAERRRRACPAGSA